MDTIMIGFDQPWLLRALKQSDHNMYLQCGAPEFVSNVYRRL